MVYSLSWKCVDLLLAVAKMLWIEHKAKACNRCRREFQCVKNANRLKKTHIYTNFGREREREENNTKQDNKKV